MLYLCEGLQEMDEFEICAVVPLTREREMSALLMERGIKSFDMKVPWTVQDAEMSGSLRAVAKKQLFPLRRLLANRQVKRIIHKEKIDIVHIGGAVIDIGYHAARDAGIPVVWHFREFVEKDHNLEYFNKRESFEEYSGASHCICVSNSVAEHYKQHISNVPITAVYNGMAFESDIRNNYPACKNIAPSGVWRMAYFSGIKATKGIFDLLQGLAAYHNTSKKTFYLDIYGNASRSEMQRFRDVIFKLGLEKCVRFKGWARIDHDLLNDYDVTFTCSRAEAFGRVTADAMCNGLLVIGANSAGTGELLADGRGILYNAGDVQSLTAAIDSVINGDVSYDETTKRAHCYAVEQFSREKYVASIASIYREIMNPA